MGILYIHDLAKASLWLYYILHYVSSGTNYFCCLKVRAFGIMFATPFWIRFLKHIDIEVDKITNIFDNLLYRCQLRYLATDT